MNAYSYHIFMFPFQWQIKGYDDKVFSEQISLKNIDFALNCNWNRIIEPVIDSEVNDLYNERNYFYEFVHDALYDNGNDNSLVRHFEREEPKHSDINYVIDCGGKGVYELKVCAINLNLYFTGVGVLSFYLKNEKYSDPVSVFRINQGGRRVFPPYIGDVKSRNQIAHSIEIKGLHGRDTGYREDFKRFNNKTKSNTPASFITDMINEVALNITLKPVVDDRMFVQCYYKNEEWAEKFSGKSYQQFLNSSDWYEFVFIDEYGGMTCQNEKMQRDLIKKATYPRWQRSKSLYGISRYSMMLLTSDTCPQFLLDYFVTMYTRMAELILVQKSSVLRFSAEVTYISNMEEKKGFVEKASSLYKEYIRFVNQIHFREVSAQEQGIELYQMLYDVMNLEKHVNKLDDEISELYNYVSLKEDRKSNGTMERLTKLATIAIPATVMAGVFGMNNSILNDGKHLLYNGYLQIFIVATVTILFGLIINTRKK